VPVVPPESLQFLVEIEADAQFFEQALVPLLSGEVLAHGAQIEDRDTAALLAEAGGSADHEGALPGLP
jgi:hypothetical protein